MLTIRDLHVETDNKSILKGINLEVLPGEVHAIMGPNGSGKSTLANILAGREGYEITQGDITYDEQDLTTLSPEERAHRGIFLAFQYPVEIPGVSNVNFLKAAINSVRLAQEKTPYDAMEFLEVIEQKLKAIGMSKDFLYRSLNAGFSGGEKKRNEVLQMALLEPRLAILDETDSGLDIDALKAVAEGVNQLRDQNRAFVIVTHYQRLLDYITPDKVHVLSDGKIVKSGDKNLAHELEKQGYAWLQETAGA